MLFSVCLKTKQQRAVRKDKEKIIKSKILKETMFPPRINMAFCFHRSLCGLVFITGSLNIKILNKSRQCPIYFHLAFNTYIKAGIAITKCRYLKPLIHLKIPNSSPYNPPPPSIFHPRALSSPNISTHSIVSHASKSR